MCGTVCFCVSALQPGRWKEEEDEEDEEEEVGEEQ